MTERQLLEFLQDILDTLTDIETFTDQVEFEAFQANREKVLAVDELPPVAYATVGF